MYENSNKIFIGRFESKVAKTSWKEYMQFTLSPEDFEKLEKAKNDKGWASFFVSKSQKTWLPYLSYTPRNTDLPPIAKSINDESPF